MPERRRISILSVQETFRPTRWTPRLLKELLINFRRRTLTIDSSRIARTLNNRIHFSRLCFSLLFLHELQASFPPVSLTFAIFFLEFPASTLFANSSCSLFSVHRLFNSLPSSASLPVSSGGLHLRRSSSPSAPFQTPDHLPFLLIKPFAHSRSRCISSCFWCKILSNSSSRFFYFFFCFSSFFNSSCSSDELEPSLSLSLHFSQYHKTPLILMVPQATQ